MMLIVPDAEAAVAWYKRALGATELWNLGGVAGLEIKGAPFFLHEANQSNNPAEDSPDRIGVTSTRIEVFADDPDGLRERAIAAGASPGRRSKITSTRGECTGRAASAIPSDTTGRSATGLRCRDTERPRNLLRSGERLSVQCGGASPASRVDRRRHCRTDL